MEINAVKIEELNVDAPYYESYFGKEKEYYMNVVNKLQQGEVFVRNWYTFFFGFGWLVYRKMYVEALIGFLSVILIDFLLDPFVNSEAAYNRSTTLLYALFMGFFGNKIYVWKTNRIIARAKEKFENKDDQLAYLESKGGTSIVAVIILALIFVAVIACEMVAYE